MKKKIITLMVIAGFFALPPAFAQTNRTTMADSVTIHFANKALKGGMMEVSAGRLATTKAQRADVRTFGAQMVTDHSKANVKLMTLIKSKGIPYDVPPKLDDAVLNNASGTNFDRHYVQMMVKDHEEDVALFEKATTNVPDKDIRMFAAQTLPVLKSHLQKIKAIAAQMQIAH